MATITAILFKSKTLATGEHPIMLRVSQFKVRKHISLGISAPVKCWDEKSGMLKRNHPYQDKYNSIIAKAVNDYRSKLVDFKHEGKEFTPDVLISETDKRVKKITVFEFFRETVKRFENNKQIGNSKVYRDTFNQLKKFTNNKDLTFNQIDYSFLLRFEDYLKPRSESDNGVSVRMRTLRALFNAAIKQGYAKKDRYPFEEFKISERYSTQTRKRAISYDDKGKIEAMQLKKYSAAFEAQQYFLFSYYCKGINFVDIAHLKWSDIVDDRVFYKRAKTGGEINFKLSSPALQIISYWRFDDKPSKDDYIFPILNKQTHITPTQKHNRVHKVLTRVNRCLKKIGEDAGISTLLTSYVARHTFATVLKRSGVATSIISQSMGHQTEAITQVYLKSFEDSFIDEAMENLL